MLVVSSSMIIAWTIPTNPMLTDRQAETLAELRAAIIELEPSAIPTETWTADGSVHLAISFEYQMGALLDHMRWPYPPDARR